MLFRSFTSKHKTIKARNFNLVISHLTQKYIIQMRYFSLMRIMYIYFILMNVNVKYLWVFMPMDIWVSVHMWKIGQHSVSISTDLYLSFWNLEFAASDTLLVQSVLGIPKLQAAVHAFWQWNLRSSSLELQSHDQLSHLANLQCCYMGIK